MEFDIGQFFNLGDDADTLMTLIWILPIIIFVLYGQRIQLYITSGEISKKIDKLGMFVTESRADLLVHVNSELGSGLDAKIDRFLEYFTIMPVDMDPAGMVERVRHVVRLRDDSTRVHIASLAPNLDESQIARTQALVEVCATLRALHSIVTHMFLTAKRQHNYPLILPLQMMLPFVMEQATALRASVDAFNRCIPIGDSIGPMVVGMMMDGLEKHDIAFQTITASTTLDSRNIILVKPRGPVPTVGHVDDALVSLISESKPDAIVMVDAALKLEGETSGIVAFGFGAAIGGSGAERAEIETLATREHIPIYSVIIKESVIDALSPMSKEIAESSKIALDAVKASIIENTKSGQTVIVIGVGNTSGVSQ